MIACGTSGYAAGMFHLTNHAFFKALLFLSAGSIIHALADEQDMRKMGGLLNLLPFTYSMMLIGSLSLMGFPFLTGFYSKDLILEWTYSQFSINGLFAYWMGSISAFFTAFYSLRVVCLTFLRKPSVSRVVLEHVHEAPLRMALPLLFLSFFSIFIGYILKDMFVGMGTDFWGNSIFVLPTNMLLLEAEFLDVSVKIFPVCLSLVGGISAYILYNFFFKTIFLFKLSTLGRNIYIFFNRKWFFDKIYNYFLAHRVLTWGYTHAYQNIDRGIIELLGPTGLWTSLNKLSILNLKFYSNVIIDDNRIRSVFKTLLFTLLAVIGLSALYIEKTHTNFIGLYFKKTLSEPTFYGMLEYLEEVIDLRYFEKEIMDWVATYTFTHRLIHQTMLYWELKILDIFQYGPSQLGQDMLGLATFGTIFDVSIHPKLINNYFNYIIPTEIQNLISSAEINWDANMQEFAEPSRWAEASIFEYSEFEDRWLEDVRLRSQIKELYQDKVVSARAITDTIPRMYLSGNDLFYKSRY